MTVKNEMQNQMVWCQVETISVEDNFDELVASGEYDEDLLKNSFNIYVPKNDEIPYIAFHLISGTILVVGLKRKFTTDYIDVVGHLLTNGTLDGMYELLEREE